MLDKSIPYFDVIMVRDSALPPVEAPALPDGFTYRLYEKGFSAAWAEVETAVLEFDTTAQAEAFYQRDFMPHEAELEKRGVFIFDKDGRPAADAMAWWGQDAQLGRVPMLHWVAVHPDFQGLGLGRAVSCKALSLLEKEGPKGDIWLTTQTWSHVAIGLYLSLGFRAHKTYEIEGHKNGFAGSVEVLKKVMKPEIFAQYMETAIG